MILYPAIDILDGRAVRLVQGRFEDRTVYAPDPLNAATTWVRAGARFLHVVDLDGARTGAPVHLDQLARIARAAGVPVQYGGGLRSPEAIEAALAAGAARVVVGTAAHRDPELLDAAIAVHGERLAVAVDVRDGRVSADGWADSTELPGEDLIDRLGGQGVQTIVYTNVDRDGMLGGPDLAEVTRIASAVRGQLIYSGGIAELSDLEQLAALGARRLGGVVVGKALYERRFSVADGQAALGG